MSTTPQKKEDGRKGNGGRRDGAGRPSEIAKGKRPPSTQLILTQEERRIAAALGEGKIVTGIRRALAFAADHAWATAKKDQG